MLHSFRERLQFHASFSCSGNWMAILLVLLATWTRRMHSCRFRITVRPTLGQELEIRNSTAFWADTPFR
jgi:hypothetical protein